VAVVNVGAHRLEYEKISADARDAPTFVMLHEGLGSVSMWRDFPARLAAATRSNIVTYSRPGYGRSSPLLEPPSVAYMHEQALVVLPGFLDALGIRKPILFGHSDGGSIALIHAGGCARAVAGVIALAPHVFVEDVSITGIQAAKVAYGATNLRERLTRHHNDADAVFWAWNNTWLDPAFRDWNIEEYLPSIDCPILAVQGEQDEYGSMEQIERIVRAAPKTEVLKLDPCGHSPHKDQPAQVLDAVSRWAGRLRQQAPGGHHEK
jgi:pimeloyl-ACP methyl ester carboxylesterase